MTDTRKLEEQTSENKSKASGELKGSELDRVTGGGPLSSAISEVMKNFGGALNTAARGG